MPSDNPWFLYILECCDNSLYTGITNRLTIRIEAHKAGTGARYTRSHLPVKLVYSEVYQDRSSASKREWVVKKMSKSQKLELIKTGAVAPFINERQYLQIGSGPQ
jgi:putative endonuclease